MKQIEKRKGGLQGGKVFREKKRLCLECGRKYVDNQALIDHMAKTHNVYRYKVKIIIDYFQTLDISRREVLK